MVTTPWSLAHIADVAGACRVCMKKREPGSSEWAQLEDAGSLTVAEYVEAMRRGSQGCYLFDWSLPLFCPRLAQEITIPKYFANDFLQRVGQGWYDGDHGLRCFLT